MNSIPVSEEQFEMQVGWVLARAARYAQNKKRRKSLERSAVYFMTWDEAQKVFGRKKAKKLWEWIDG